MFVVYISSLRREVIDKVVSRWRFEFKYRLSEDVKREVLTESRINPYTLLAVFNNTLLGLWLALKLVDIANKCNALVTLYRSEPVTDFDQLIDNELRRRIERIPPEHVYSIKKALKELRLPKGKIREEIVNAMKT